MANKENTKWYKSWGFRQFLLAVAAAVITVMLLFLLLRFITRHGQSQQVPQFTGMTVEEAASIAKSQNLRIKISDSVYIPKMQPGQIFRQVPAAGSMVKKNRRILLTINSLSPRMVRVPNVVGLSLRQAESNLSAANLVVGKLVYIPDIATNNVLGQEYKGRVVAAGRQLPAESEIDLQVGLNSEDNMTYIPNLVGLPYHQVKTELIYNSLNLGRMVFDKSVKSYADTLQSFVYKQAPAPASSVLMGSGVTVYMTIDKELINK